MKLLFTINLPACYLLTFLLFSSLQPTSGQPIFSNGQVELLNGSIRSGQLAIQQVNKRQRVVLLDRTSKTLYQPGDLKAIQIGDEHFVSRNISATDTHHVLLRQLVMGPVSLYEFKRTGGASLLLLEQGQIIKTLNPKAPAAMLSALLTACSSQTAQANNFERCRFKT